MNPFDFRTPEEKRIDALMEEHHDFGEHPNGPHALCPLCDSEKKGETDAEKEKAEAEGSEEAYADVLG